MARITLDLPTDLLVRLDIHVEAVREYVRKGGAERGSPMPGLFAPRRPEIVAKALRFYLEHAERVGIERCASW